MSPYHLFVAVSPATWRVTSAYYVSVRRFFSCLQVVISICSVLIRPMSDANGLIDAGDYQYIDINV